MEKLEVIVRRVLIFSVAIIWGTFFGVTFQFSWPMLACIAGLTLVLVQFWD